MPIVKKGLEYDVVRNYIPQNNNELFVLIGDIFVEEVSCLGFKYGKLKDSNAVGWIPSFCVKDTEGRNNLLQEVSDFIQKNNISKGCIEYLNSCSRKEFNIFASSKEKEWHVINAFSTQLDYVAKRKLHSLDTSTILKVIERGFYFRGDVNPSAVVMARIREETSFQ